MTEQFWIHVQLVCFFGTHPCLKKPTRFLPLENVIGEFPSAEEKHTSASVPVDQEKERVPMHNTQAHQDVARTTRLWLQTKVDVLGP